MPTGGIRKQPISAQGRVLEELARLKLPTPKVLVARWRDERILQLHEQKFQMLDIAGRLRCGQIRRASGAQIATQSERQ